MPVAGLGAPRRPPEPAPGPLCCLSPPRALLLGKAAAPGKGPRRGSRNGAAGAPNYPGGESSHRLVCEMGVLAGIRGVV